MAKTRKKRNKTYTGIDAAMKKPMVTKISAANRSKAGQWWFDNKRWLKPLIKFLLIASIIIIVIFEIIQLAT